MMDRRVFLAALAAAAGFCSAAWAEGGERVAVAGGDLTEIAYALGAGAALVGVDQTSVHPAEARALPQIGYVRRLSAEGVLSLAPSMLLAAHDAGPPVALEQIRAAGVAVAVAPKGETPESVPAKIAFVGGALGRPAEAAALAEAYRGKLDTVLAKTAALTDRPRVLFILTLRDGAPMVGGAGTSADAMIRAAGGVNAAAEIQGYKPMAQEAVLAAQPDAILMMAQHAERVGGVEAMLARPEIAPTPAGLGRRAIAMEGMLLLGFGPRTPDAIAELARRLHPDADSLAGL